MSEPHTGFRDIDPANELERALLALHRGEGSREQVLTALESAEVLVPRPAGTVAPTGEVRGEAQELQLPVMRGRDGRQAVPLFTSPGRLAAAVDAETAYFQVAFRTLADGWPADVEAVIDPGGPLELTLAVGAEGPAQPGPNTVVAGTRILVGEPAQEPDQALAALRALFASTPAVEAAWRAQVYIEAPGEVPHIAIGVRAAAETDFERLFQRATEAVRGAIDGPASFVPIGARADPDDPIASHMLEQTSPFYQRG